ncbi:aminodeoxychorismate lyase [Pseudalkalibacillus hwajinpoensis]|uniref:aminodeoxychorismate lyase n=1 Tax=Guptibacillus hwajinpoensis TaxID=208199 RepID=UPI001CD2D18D|nr:aminodeoxychorismate lyase [Pseudalkalibacillus hwajinpoensis]MCA0993706.1 aminodeoxychorismate lyase [Pseudalkalibacillus hwajinpoensis]
MFLTINGKLIDEKEAAISVFDHGYLYGVGVFETFRTYEGHPFLFGDHYKRLRNSLENLQISLPYTYDELLLQIKQTIEANEMKDAYVRLNVSAGAGEIGLKTDEYLTPTVIVYVKAIGNPVRKTKRGVILSLRRNSPEGEYRLKSHHYLNNILAKREVGSDPSIEGIFLSQDGRLAEGIVSNLFWFKNGILFTPDLSTGILNGITRQFVVHVARKMGISVREGGFQRESLLEADEVFVTNSIQEIVPLFQIEQKPLPGLDGPATNELILQYEHHRTSLMSREEY